MTETAVKPIGRRRLRRVLIFVTGAILLGLLGRVGLDLWAGHRANAAVTRLEKQFGSFDEKTLAVAPVAAGENRARAVRAAAALIDFSPLTGLSDFQRLFSDVQMAGPSAPLAADVRTFVAANQSAFRVAAQARSRRASNWEADYTTGERIPRLLESRTLSTALYLAARVDIDADRADDAVTAITSGLAVSASLRQEPDMLAQLIRMAVALQQFAAVQQLVLQSEASRAPLEDLAQWLAENRTPDPVQLGLISDAKRLNALLTRVENGQYAPFGLAAELLPMEVARLTGAHDSPFWLGPLARLARPLIRLARVRYLEQVGPLAEAQMGPRPRPASHGTPARWGFLRRLDALSFDELAHAMDTGDLFNSALGVTELAVALRRFRLDYGHYPDVLSALVPTYVARVPLDSLTGKAPVYARQGAGFDLRAEIPRDFPAVTTAPLTWTVSR